MIPFTSAKHLSGFDVMSLTALAPHGRNLLTVDTHLGFTSVYGALLYALADYHLYWLPGAVGDQYLVVRADFGVLRLVASSHSADAAAQVFNAAVGGNDVMHWR